MKKWNRWRTSSDLLDFHKLIAPTIMGRTKKMKTKTNKVSRAMEEGLLRLSEDMDPERARQYLGKEMVENDDERDEVLWGMERDK